MRAFLRAAAVVLGLAAAPAQAAFHLWTMDELYSNSDGTIQFLELTALTGGQQFIAGHNLTASSGGNTNSFTFPSNLPGDTSGKRMLIGTQGFAALGVVTPDYVVPNNFFFRNGGSVNFAGVEVWNHGALPTDNRSINQGGVAAVNSPTNFAGQSGTVTAAPPGLNFQGLWWRSPALSESGWGVNIAHQGDTFFVTWFTYDTDGTQMWLVGDKVVRTTGNTYTGPLYRTTGSPFNAVPFTPLTASNVTQVGSVTFSFTDATNGTFQYTVNNVTQSKPITRQVFGPLPTCTTGGTPTANPNFSGLWFREVEAGWGVNVTQQGDIVFATWFTYDAAGRGMWIVGDRMLRTTGNTFAGNLYRTTGPSFSLSPWTGTITPILVGSGSFTFHSATSATFSYTVSGTSQTKEIAPQNLDFSVPLTVCRP